MCTHLSQLVTFIFWVGGLAEKPVISGTAGGTTASASADGD